MKLRKWENEAKGEGEGLKRQTRTGEASKRGKGNCKNIAWQKIKQLIAPIHWPLPPQSVRLSVCLSFPPSSRLSLALSSCRTVCEQQIKLVATADIDSSAPKWPTSQHSPVPVRPPLPLPSALLLLFISGQWAVDSWRTVSPCPALPCPASPLSGQLIVNWCVSNYAAKVARQ